MTTTRRWPGTSAAGLRLPRGHACLGVEALGAHRAFPESSFSPLLARAATPAQETRVGNQAGGRVFLFLETDDFARDHAAFSARGVRFVEEPRREAYGMVCVFEDLYGNRWDLIGRAT